jgi:hypothetical protein
MKHPLFSFLFLVASSMLPLSAQTVPQSNGYFPQECFLDTNLEYSKHMLSLQSGVTDKTAHILRSLRDGELETGKVYLSGHLSYSNYFERTDTPGKFPILGRFPNQHTPGRSATEDVIDTANLALTYAPSEWLSVYLAGMYTEIEFPGQDDTQLREAFVTFGNLDKSPFYLSVGKKTVNFGKLEAYNPTTHSVSNHFYRTDSKDAVIELGYLTEDWHLSATAIHGGRQLRVADSPDDGAFANFALTAQRNFKFRDWDISVGAGYLSSTIYDSDSANHPGVAPDPLTEQERNGAVDLWIEAQRGKWSFMAEYTKTERDWPATGRAVEALTLQVAYDTELWSKPTRLSLVYGRGQQGYNRDEFHELEQLALGIETFVTANFSLSAEYVYNRGFVPLIMIGRASDGGVDTHTLILSGKLYF